MNIIRTACAKTCQHGATFIVETPVGYVDTQEIHIDFGHRYGAWTYFFAMTLEGWRYEYRLDRSDQLTRTGKSRLAAKFARECYFIYAGSITSDKIAAYVEGQARAGKWRDSP